MYRTGVLWKNNPFILFLVLSVVRKKVFFFNLIKSKIYVKYAYIYVFQS